MADVARAVACDGGRRSCDLLRDEPRTVEPLEGGLTNVNFKVSTPGCTAVVRLSSSDGDLLAIDRDAEHANSLRAAESGAAPAGPRLPAAPPGAGRRVGRGARR